MNPWQTIKTVQSVLEARVWTGGTAKVLSKAIITSAAWDEAFIYRLPFCLLRVGSARLDPEHEEYLEQDIEMLLAVEIPGDALGQGALIGANRTGGNTTSKGRGILEIEEEVLSAIAGMRTSGFRLQLSAAGVTAGITKEGRPYAVAREYVLTGKCSRDRYYHPPRNLTAVGAVGSVTLAWKIPPSIRPDLLRVKLRRAAGATAPATAADGTAVALASDLATSVVDTPAAGTYSYAIFAAYDESGNGSEERYSDQETGTTRLSVVVT